MAVAEICVATPFLPITAGTFGTLQEMLDYVELP